MGSTKKMSIGNSHLVSHIILFRYWFAFRHSFWVSSHPRPPWTTNSNNNNTSSAVMEFGGPLSKSTTWMNISIIKLCAEIHYDRDWYPRVLARRSVNQSSHSNSRKRFPLSFRHGNNVSMYVMASNSLQKFIYFFKYRNLFMILSIS